MADQKSPTREGPKLYRYPLTFLDAQSDYMRFDVVKYVPPGIESISGTSIISAPGSSQESIGNAINQRGKEVLQASMMLPMPLSLQDQKKTAWERGDLDFITASIGSAVQALINNQNPSDGDLANQLLNFGSNAASVFKKGGQEVAGSAAGIADITSEYIANILVNMTPGSLEFKDQLLRNRGIVINPNAEYLFRGPSLRSFTFAYTFVPRNQKEAEQVRMIVRTFKKVMSPKANIAETGGMSNANALKRGFLGSPDVFRIQYMRGPKPHPFLNKFKYCALTNISVDYTGHGQEGYISYEDGTPICTTMAMQFTELTPVYAEDYGDEKNPNDKNLGGVGY